MENRYIIGSILETYPPIESGLESLLILSRGQLFTDSGETLENWGVQYKLPGEKSFELYLYGKGEELKDARQLFDQLKIQIENSGLKSAPIGETLKEQSKSYPLKDPYLFLGPIVINNITKWEVSCNFGAEKVHYIYNHYEIAFNIFNDYIQRSIKSSVNIKHFVEGATKPKTSITSVEKTPNGLVIETTEEEK